MSTIRPHSLDPQTVERLRVLVATTYAGRDDLYQVAVHLDDAELASICRKLADELAGNSAHLAQILAMHGTEADDSGAISAVLTDEIVRFLREHERDKGVLSAAKDVERGVRDQYDATIAATENPEAQALVKKQREEADFGEKVLRHIAKDGGGSTTPPAK
jgi:uncharacterized protein (TIGR02284 family)